MKGSAIKSKSLSLLILGNGGVGKSQLLLRFMDDKFCENYVGTIGSIKKDWILDQGV